MRNWEFMIIKLNIFLIAKEEEKNYKGCINCKKQKTKVVVLFFFSIPGLSALNQGKVWGGSENYCFKHSLRAFTEVFVDWRKQKIGKSMFFANFVIVYIKIIIHLSIHLSSKNTQSRSQALAHHLGMEKYNIYCFGSERRPKWDFEN